MGRVRNNRVQSRPSRHIGAVLILGDDERAGLRAAGGGHCGQQPTVVYDRAGKVLCHVRTADVPVLADQDQNGAGYFPFG